MAENIFKLWNGVSLSHWMVTPVVEEPCQYETTVMNVTGNLNDWLVKGFSIYENPGRAAVIHKVLQQEVTPISSPVASDSRDCWTTYIPLENPYVECSGFWTEPTLLSRWAYSALVSVADTHVEITLKTAGGVILWVNGVQMVKFYPFTRNLEKEMTCTVPLKGGTNELLVYALDIAERDALFRFQVSVRGEDPLSIWLPLSEEEGTIAHYLEQSVSEAYFPRDVVTSGRVEFLCSNPLSMDVEVIVAHHVEWGPWQGPLHESSRIWSAGSDRIVVAPVGTLDIGVTLFKFTFQVGRVAVVREAILQVFPAWWKEVHGADKATRARQILALIAKYGLDNIPRVAALITQEGNTTSTIERILEAELLKIDRREDCSDFSLVMIFRILKLIQDKPSLQSLVPRIEETVRKFRYWFDEPGHDVMWFFSENHELLFHVCEFLAGELLPYDMFDNGLITGSAHRDQARERLIKWFDRFFQSGFAEWNSAPYLPINIMGLLELRDMAQDTVLRGLAEKALDIVFTHMASNAFRGYLSCTQGRTYDKELRGNFCNTTTAILWLAYGVGNANPQTFGVVSMALSDYAPPEETMALSTGDDTWTYRAVQGSEPDVSLYTYHSPNFVLSTADTGRAGQPGYSEHLLHVALGEEAVIWINHPGEWNHVGYGRPSYWAGNGILPQVCQYKHMAVVLFQIPQSASVDMTHAYFPTMAFDEVITENGWWGARVGYGCVALWAANGLELTRRGLERDRELVSPGRKNVWMVRVGNLSQFGNLQRFIAECVQVPIRLDGPHQITIADPLLGRIDYGWGRQLLVNGCEDPTQPHNHLPHIHKEGRDR